VEAGPLALAQELETPPALELADLGVARDAAQLARARGLRDGRELEAARVAAVDLELALSPASRFRVPRTLRRRPIPSLRSPSNRRLPMA